ncbi:MAG: D-aminoacylase [Gemmatimonadaceae bacterium]
MTTSRRSFITTTGGALVAVACAPSIAARRADHDLVVRNGTVFDGSGAEGREMDVAIANGRIVEVGARLARGREEIDARGLAVAPGFIDIHSHGDGNLNEDPRAESIVRQGVTTIVVGADGSSRATGADDRSFAAYFAAMDKLAPGVNVASMVGLGSVRGAVIGNINRPPTTDELSRMSAMVERALADGACGTSSGLEYTPSGFASLEELIALCRPLVKHGLPYATHMRNEDDRLLEAIDESLAVAKGAGCALQISHLKTQGPRNWPKLDTVFARVESARAAGADVAFDRYPYVAYATGLTNFFPLWSRDGGSDAFLARLADPATAARIKAEAIPRVDLIGGWDNVQVSSVRAAEDRDVEGKRLGAFAKSKGVDPYDLTVDLLRRSKTDVGILGFAMSEENLDRILAHPLGMVCSDGGGFAADGPTRRGSPHPRGAGSFARVLGRYVRERKALTLASAIRKMTSQPAERVHLRDRGRIAPGFAADVVVFDPAKVSDTATFEQPFQYPVGINAVVVNGIVALRDGYRSPTQAGRGLKAQQAR